MSALHFGGARDIPSTTSSVVIIGPAILGELEEGLVETGGWASDRAAPVRAELEVIAEG